MIETFRGMLGWIKPLGEQSELTESLGELHCLEIIKGLCYLLTVTFQKSGQRDKKIDCKDALSGRNFIVLCIFHFCHTIDCQRLK